MPASPPRQAPPRIRIESPWPMVDCGRFPIKRTVGDVVEVSADIWRDGNLLLALGAFGDFDPAEIEMLAKGMDQRADAASTIRR